MVVLLSAAQHVEDGEEIDIAILSIVVTDPRGLGTSSDDGLDGCRVARYDSPRVFGRVSDL